MMSQPSRPKPGTKYKTANASPLTGYLILLKILSNYRLPVTKKAFQILTSSQSHSEIKMLMFDYNLL